MQYTLAVDRGNANLASRFTALHPAVLELIYRTVNVAEKNGLDVSVCGEMASQPLMAYALLGLGVRSLSVSPRGVPLIKRIVRAMRIDDASRAAAVALASPTAALAEMEIRRGLSAALANAPAPTDGLLGMSHSI